MSHTIRLTFGPMVSIEITRDARRRVSQIETFFEERVEGYRLDANPERREGTFYAMPSNIIGERYKDGRLHSPTSSSEGQTPVVADYHSWIRRCVQQATAWARSAAITAAHDAVNKGDYHLASETYRDVLDHFPPPPEAPLLHWAYFCCIASMEGIEEARDGLLMWFHDALQIAGIEALNSVLLPGSKLLGEEITAAEAEKWLLSSSPHDPAHKLTVRWLNRVGQGEPERTRWEHYPGLDLDVRERKLVLLPDGDVLAVGGIGMDYKPSSIVCKWSNQEQKWTEMSPFPFGVHRHSVVSLYDGTVLVIGGEAFRDGKRKRYSTEVWAWNKKSDVWTQKAPLNIGRQDFSAVVSKTGRVVVVGGESPLQTEASIELWDRRTNKWQKTVSTGIRLRGGSLHHYKHSILIAGPSVCGSGSGALLFSPKTGELRPFAPFKGIGIDGLRTLLNGDILLWAKSSGELNVGIWSPKKKNIVWSCSEIPIPYRDDLARLYPCEDGNLLLLYAKDDGNCGVRFVRPAKGLVDEIEPIAGPNRIETLCAITLSDGRVLAGDSQGTALLST